MSLFLTPQQIVHELDKYIIGQIEAKRNVAIALRNRWRRMNIQDEIRSEIIPNNILMIGPTGVGKTEIARRMASLADAPFIKVEASKFTEVGYVGRDVESMVRDLVEQSINMVKTHKREVIKEKVLLAVEEIMLNTLIPPIKSKPKGSPSEDGNTTEHELNEETRKHFRKKIQNGELEDRKIEITISGNQNSGIGMIGAGVMDEVSMMNMQDMLSGLMPKEKKKRKVTIAEARRILIEEESSRLIDIDEVKEEALKKAQEAGIIFIDEIDKIASSYAEPGKGSGSNVSQEGVQRDLLPIVEGSTVNTKYGVVKTDHMLFISAGAFHDCKPSDLIPELQGRFPIRVELDTLTKDDFIRILTEPKNALTKQYKALFKTENVNLSFEPKAIETIADVACQINTEMENIGARRLHTVMSKLLNEFLFDMPDNMTLDSIVITTDKVNDTLIPLIQNRNLSEYIL